MNIKTRKLANFLVFSFILGAASFAYGATDDSRYLIKTNSVFWKRSFGVHNDFKDSFTTDLFPWQIKVAHVFGIEVVPVLKLNILDNVDPLSVASTGIDISNNGKNKPSPAPSPSITPLPSGSPLPSVSPSVTPLPRPTPSSQIPWGIKDIYNNDPALTKTSGGAGVNVAVLDTGITGTHPDLKSRITQCKDFTSPKPVVNNQCDDKNGHGTHVSGIIAADGGADGLGIYGVAPEVNLFAYKVCGANGSCWADDIATAIKTAADNGANVINMSLGSDTPNSMITDAVSYAVGKHVLIVAAAGNDGPYQGSIDYPAADPNVISVGAFDPDLKIPDWSSRGINSTDKPYVVEEKDIEYAAPGLGIESTWKDGSYMVLSGTSMATPHVAGLAAKLWQRNDPSPDTATRLLLQTNYSHDLAPVGDDDASGFGFPHL